MTALLKKFSAINPFAAGASLQQQVSQYFTANQTLSLDEALVNYHVSPGFGEALTLTIVGQNVSGGVRYYAVEYVTDSTSSAYAKINTFLIANPTFLPQFILDVTPPEKRFLQRLKLMLIYTTDQPCGEATGVGWEYNNTLAGVTAVGNRLHSDLSIYDVISLRNSGNQTWIWGGRAVIFRNQPALGTASCVWTGIGPCCYAGPKPPVTAPAPVTTTHTCPAPPSPDYRTTTPIVPPAPNPTTAPTPTLTNPGATTTTSPATAPCPSPYSGTRSVDLVVYVPGQVESSAEIELLSVLPPPKCCYKIVIGWTASYPPPPSFTSASLSVVWGVAPGATATTGDCIGSAGSAVPGSIGPFPGPTVGTATYHTCNAKNIKFIFQHAGLAGDTFEFHATITIILEDQGGCP